MEQVRTRDELDESLGFHRLSDGDQRLGWMTVAQHNNSPNEKSGVDVYFLEEDGGMFKSTILYDPYFYVICKDGTEADVEEYLRRRFNKVVQKVTIVTKEDLRLNNHLLGNTRKALKLSFHNVQSLLQVRKVLLPASERNKRKNASCTGYADVAELTAKDSGKSVSKGTRDALEYIEDLREYDVPYYIRAAIDKDLRVGKWYDVKADQGVVSCTLRPDKVKRADPVVLAFDIETTKLPLKFPDASIDCIMMISYMIDGQGFLITNREIVSEDIEDFEYTPKPEYEGPFTIFNEPDEAGLIARFFEHIRDAKPTVFVTYNGDWFDWPFVEARALANGLNMEKEIGFAKDSSDEYKSSYAIHMDALHWVKRDSYLPQGSQGLKAVTKEKLGYNPMEIDPEDMTRFAAEEPQTLAQYSVSDAVATYYLYMKYVHPFIFSLCNIIPMNPDDVLRKGSGTLCETLLMVEAYRANVIMPNKHEEESGKFFEGHLLEGETYVGGHVEALEAGVFRSDLPAKFNLVPEAFQQLLNEVDAALRFSIIEEGGLKMEDVTNYEEVRSEIVRALENLRDTPRRLEKPLIYHLDVAAMYPNIILTNRLQPDAMVEDETCAACDFNEGPGSSCQRKMPWSWRGEFFPAKRSEYNMIRNQMEQEKFPPRNPGEPPRAFHDLPKNEQNTLLKKRLSDYCRKVYNKIHETKTIGKESTVCQRENPFYIDTVRAFRDRRYEYKNLLKTWKGNLEKANQEGDLTKADEAKKLTIVYDSLQLAHKCILNSFYGYVMRKGARWYSMEMAGIVCLTGARIIQLARSRIEQLGRPLELDTDGIWCILPQTFPENYKFQLKNGKAYNVSYPCSMLNHLVHAEFTNHQYQQLEDPMTKTYSIRSENSIFFEVDGPYRAMILPSSTEEDKLLKKRYAVFKEDGTLAELKGFEVKRRGELKLIKIFQNQIFHVFLAGSTLEECYAEVATVANQWLDVLYSKGADLDDAELFELISENRSMSKSLENYGAQKSTSISTAKRLAEFLGDQMVKDKGLNCKFVISAKPHGLPVSDRAIPVAIFQAEPSIRKHFLRKWLKDNSLQTFDIRDILDWQYYLDRFGSVIQKLITIPAAMQDVKNPVPRVRHPEWLFKRVAARDDKYKQHRITDMFKRKELEEDGGTAEFADLADMEVDSDEENDATGMGSRGVDIGDVEDIGKSRPHVSVLQDGKIIPIVHKNSRVLGKRKERDGTDTAVVGLDNLPENMPDPYVDYHGWLEYQKRKWKRRRAEKTSAANGRVRGIAEVPGVQGFFRRQTRSVLTMPWHILQVAETDIPGDFRVWAMVGGGLHSIKLTVPRVFYVNSRIPHPEEDPQPGLRMERKVRTLPRSHQCLYLYELTMAESFYRENAGMFASMFNHQKIEGVYETQVPLLFQALVRLGCIATVNPNRVTSGRGLDDAFELKELQHKEADARHPYLKDSNLHWLYLFHANTGNRHVVGLFSTAAKKAWICVVDPAGDKDSVPNLRQMYSKAKSDAARGEVGSSQAQYSQQSQSPAGREPDTFTYPDELEIVQAAYKKELDAMFAINRALREYQDHRFGPTVLAVQSARTTRRLLMDGISVIHDFPTLTVPFHKKDADLPLMAWQIPTCRRMVSHFLNLNEYLKNTIARGRYGDVPFCNIEHDAPVFLSDLSLARRLKRADMLLWFSLDNKPDLGGREQDDHRCELDELVHPEINVTGCYTSVCVEIELWDLALNTLLQSTAVTDLEGAGAVGGGIGGVEATAHLMDGHLKDSGAVPNTDEDSSMEGSQKPVVVGDESQVTPATFSLIKGMVRNWAEEVQGRRNPFAAPLLEHLYRWLTSPSSRLYDPALHALVHGLMRRLFFQLMAEFQRLGSKVVYASFDRFILATNKTEMAKGIGYSTYVIDALVKKPLFEMLEFKPMRFWDYLLWMDPHNFGGMECTNPEEVLASAAAFNINGTQARTSILHPCVELAMEWNIGEYLPPAVQVYFLRVIGDFIVEVAARKRRLLDNKVDYKGDSISRREGGSEEGDSDVAEPQKGKRRGIPGSGEENEEEANDMPAVLRKVMGTLIRRRLFDILPKIRNGFAGANDEDRGDWEFPPVPGSHTPAATHTQLRKIELQFVKYVCHVFGIDPHIEREVRLMRRDLLRLVEVNEFSDEANFTNPCEPFKLSHVICEFCNHCQDLDLTRDKTLRPLPLPVDRSRSTAEEEEQRLREQAQRTREKQEEKRWACPMCNEKYDQSAIEQRLVEVVHRRLTAWQMQDLKCTRCRMIKAEDLRDTCPDCSGRLQTELNRDDFERRMNVFASIAKYHKMEMLAEVVGWVLEML
ncbi:DNA polymerase epsilon catalytic subunit [Borealophlyctis nickersoniae]|nr:DNA polymerase epsilon catalytic subunit [Borealophlyctis nickersoniae]